MFVAKIVEMEGTQQLPLKGCDHMDLNRLNQALLPIANLSSLSVDTVHSWLQWEHDYPASSVVLEAQLDELCLLGYLKATFEGTYRRMEGWKSSSASRAYGLYAGLSGEAVL